MRKQFSEVNFFPLRQYPHHNIVRKQFSEVPIKSGQETSLGERDQPR